VVGPSPHDRHPAHETVGRALIEALESSAGPDRLWLWALWGGTLPFPTTYVEYGDDRLAEIAHALEAHASQLDRNDYRRLLIGRGLASAVLGGELVHGFGSAGLEGPYAELTCEVVRTREGWRLGAARALDPDDPFPDPTGSDVGGWLHAPSAVDL
jgi:LmbE family N-acetylglucosaminyl deacetylase